MRERQLEPKEPSQEELIIEEKRNELKEYYDKAYFTYERLDEIRGLGLIDDDMWDDLEFWFAFVKNATPDMVENDDVPIILDDLVRVSELTVGEEIEEIVKKVQSIEREHCQLLRDYRDIMDNELNNKYATYIKELYIVMRDEISDRLSNKMSK